MQELHQESSSQITSLIDVNVLLQGSAGVMVSRVEASKACRSAHCNYCSDI